MSISNHEDEWASRKRAREEDDDAKLGEERRTTPLIDEAHEDRHLGEEENQKPAAVSGVPGRGHPPVYYHAPPPQMYPPAAAGPGYDGGFYPPPYQYPPQHYGMPPPGYGGYYDPHSRWMQPPPYGHYGAGYPPHHSAEHHESYAAEHSKPHHNQHHPHHRGEEDNEPDNGPSTAADDIDDAPNAGASVVSAMRLKTYIKPIANVQSQDVLDRRARKNAQSRARATKMRSRIIDIEQKPEEERTEEELHIWEQFENRRARKNNRSRERAVEKKEEIDRILTKPDRRRTKIEKQFLETALTAKQRKNEGDRLRRQRLKELGLSTKGTGIKPGISARGPLPREYAHLQVHRQHHHHHHPPQPLLPHFPHHAHPQHHHQQQHPMYGMPPPLTHMTGGEIPMSPMPGNNTNMHHPEHAPPQTAPYSPGMMQHHPMMPTQHGGAYGGGASPQRPSRNSVRPSASSRVEQRRNPDGSLSISIGAVSTAAQDHHEENIPVETNTTTTTNNNDDEKVEEDHEIEKAV
jgi:hypothetical protein